MSLGISSLFIGHSSSRYLTISIVLIFAEISRSEIQSLLFRGFHSYRHWISVHVSKYTQIFLKPERQYTRIYFSVTFGFASLYLFYINARPWDQYLQGPLFPSHVRFLQVTGSHLSFSCCCLYVIGTQHVCLST